MKSLHKFRHGLDTVLSWVCALLFAAMVIGSVLAGAIWAFVPAWFKSRWNTNETLFTLMMNYIIIGVVRWLQGGPWEGRPGSQIIPQFDSKAVLPKVLGVHCGWIIVLVLTVVMFIYMKYTKQGYEIAVIGESENTARYAGMNVGAIIMRTMFLSAAICGLAGVMQVSGADMQLTDSVAGGVGFTAIIVAWLARLSPAGILLTSILFGIMEKGSGTIESTFKISPSMADVLQGIILFFVLGAEFFINYRLMFRNRVEKGGVKA